MFENFYKNIEPQIRRFPNEPEVLPKLTDEEITKEFKNNE
jgi:hypothetical protein